MYLYVYINSVIINYEKLQTNKKLISFFIDTFN